MVPGRCVVDLEGLAGREDVDVEAVLRDVDADKECRHGTPDGEGSDRHRPKLALANAGSRPW